MFIVNTVEKGINIRADGWECEYMGNCRAAKIEYDTNIKQAGRGSQLPTHLATMNREELAPNAVRDEDLSNSNCNESDFEVDPLLERYDSVSRDDEPEGDGETEDKHLAGATNMKDDDMPDIPNKVAAYVDIDSYYVFLSARDAIAFRYHGRTGKSQDTGHSISRQ